MDNNEHCLCKITGIRLDVLFLNMDKFSKYRELKEAFIKEYYSNLKSNQEINKKESAYKR
jgi:hypothetical protein